MPRTERIISPFLPIYAALGLALGILALEQLYATELFTCSSEQLQPSSLWLLLPLPLLLIPAWLGRKRRRVLIPALIMILALVGAWRYTISSFEPCFGPNDLATYNSDTPYGRPSVLEGIIVGWPEQRHNYNQYRVRMDSRWEGEYARPVDGIALVRSDKEKLYAYGDRIRIRGVAATPPTFPDFDYRRFLARKDIHTLIKRATITHLASDQGHPFWSGLYRVRAGASDILNEILPEPYSALANGMILGIENGIPRELYDDFNLIGTSHVIVISGDNITLLCVKLRLFDFQRPSETIFSNQTM